ncbi:IS21 family transposase [Bacteroidota bacterium]
MKIKQILRLYTQGKSKKSISSQLGISRNTVKNYIAVYNKSKLTFDNISQLSDIELATLFEPTIKEVPARRQALKEEFVKLEKELKKPRSTRMQYWLEYSRNNPKGYSYSRFCVNFQTWLKESNPSLHIEHKAGDKMYIDFAGKKLHIVDKITGEIKDVEVFVSVLGCSQLTYVEAVLSQQKEDFIQCVENALWYYKGVPAAIVPDNLKSAVNKTNRYEPILNETFEDFALHYQTNILPARVRKPKDKSLVEGAVKLVYQRIYRHVQDKTYYDLEQLNKAIHVLLQQYNEVPFSRRDYSRMDIYKEIEKQQLIPLPDEKYEIQKYALGTVHKNCHVYLSEDKHYYSVPYEFISKKIKVKYTSKKVWIYYKYEQIALHNREKIRYGYTTKKEHLPTSHQFITEWNPEKFTQWAESIGPNTSGMIQQVLKRKQYPEQNYRSCLGILQLSKKAGSQRLEQACARAMDYQIYNYSIIKSILEKQLDQVQEQAVEITLPDHNNIRGNNYYK